MHSRDPIRIFRVAGPRPHWVLDDGTGLYDLSDRLRRRGRSDDLLEVAADGWFEPESLEARLPRSQGDGLGEWVALPADAEGLPTAPLAVPVEPGSVGKILALGKNFQAHAEEFQEEVPQEPLFFNKLPETLVPSGSTVTIPAEYTQRVDHEVELAIVIGLEGRDIDPSDAWEHVAFATLANDLTARSMQGWDRKRSYPWFRAKNMDGFCPLGPALIPTGYLNLANQELLAHVNGELRQSANTRDMVVSIPTAVAYLSRHLTLRAGDLILMGTPEGVGPLHDGDVVVCSSPAFGSLITPTARPISRPISRPITRPDA